MYIIFYTSIMPYKLKETLISALSSTVSTVAFLFYIVNRYQQESVASENELTFWATGMLIFIGVRIVVQIAVSILYGIFAGMVSAENNTDLADERDNLIELYSSQVRDGLFSIGLVLAIVFAAAGQGAAALFITIMVGGSVSEVGEYIAKLIMYKKGV